MFALLVDLIRNFLCSISILMNGYAPVSQVEHGVLHLVDEDNPQITVLVDCDGLSPLKIPMQMMRSCSSLLHDNFPNRLGHLVVIRLPPVVRVIAQTFIQVSMLSHKDLNDWSSCVTFFIFCHSGL